MIGDYLSNRLKNNIVKNLKKSQIRENDLEATLTDLRLTLIESDINLQVVDKLIAQFSLKSQSIFLEKKMKAHQAMIKIVYEEIVRLLGVKPAKMQFTNAKNTIMMVGLQGSGKTTTTAKLANLIKKQNGRKVLLVAADIYRPAAVEQLQQLGSQLNVDVYAEPTNQNVVSICENAVTYATDNKYDTLIFDTAGRLHIDKVLMNELQQIRNVVSPQEIILVLDGMTGQDIINIANAFKEYLKLTGVIITKLDGDTKGGAALSIRYLTNLPIKFIGTGEKTSDLQLFYPERIAQRILGMGDLKTLFEKIHLNVEARTYKKSLQRMLSGKFDMQDFLNQTQQIAKIGKLGTIAKMLPGMPKVTPEKIATAQEKLYLAEIFISSMTREERENTRYLKHLSRKKRIISGSGRTEKEYLYFLNQFEKTRKDVNQFMKAIRQEKNIHIPGLS